jgi:predicted nucleotidyltransferase
VLSKTNKFTIFAMKGDLLMKLIENNIQMIIDLCKKYKVNKLFVFGSILTNRFNETSDIDMVVDFDRIDLMDYADNYFDLKSSLQDLLGREVDLLEEKGIRNPILKKNIDNTKQLVYG